MMNKCLGLSLVFLMGASAYAQDLSYQQKQAVRRQESNRKSYENKFNKAYTRYTSDMKQLKGKLIPPAYFKGHLNVLSQLEGQVPGINRDLDKVKSPASNSQVKALKDFVVDITKKMIAWKKELETKRAAADKIANPKNYPNLQADWKKLKEVQKKYGRVSNLRSQRKIGKVQEMAEEFADTVAWYRARFKEYRSYIIMNGGKKNRLYMQFVNTSKSIKKFQAKASDFVKEAEKAILRYLEQAEKSARTAAEEKKPGLFRGGVRQNLKKAKTELEVWAALTGGKDAKQIAMQKKYNDCVAKTEKIKEQIKELLIAEARAPQEKYTGADKEDLRKKVLAAWKKKYPADTVLHVRFKMENWDRTQKLVWNSSDKSWEKVDKSVLVCIVIVKTNDRIGTMYPAFFNKNNLNGRLVIGIDTKRGGYVVTEMLLSNLN